MLRSTYSVSDTAKCYLFTSVTAVFYFRSQGSEKLSGLSKATQLAGRGGEIQMLALVIMLLPIEELSFWCLIHNLVLSISWGLSAVAKVTPGP